MSSLFDPSNPALRGILIGLDILIVAFVLYRVFRLLSRTRAVQLLIGFGLIIVMDVVAKKMQLATISWLITNVSSYLVFGLIVILQPELRRLLAEMGKTPVFQWFSPSPEVPIKEITEAAREMAAGKVGSIMIILREIRPQAIIDNAVSLEAKVTTELLETIFFKDTPLHDGAVIIEGSRIVAASCYLPLSHSRNIKKTYGARHRAALGFSEDSDSVILVTSEETGNITLMKDGEMQTPIAPGDLEHLDFLLNQGSMKQLREEIESGGEKRAKPGEDDGSPRSGTADKGETPEKS